MSLWTEAGPFTLAEVATECRCSTRFLQKVIRAGELRVCRLGRRVRLRGSEARRFARAVGCEPPVEANLAPGKRTKRTEANGVKDTLVPARERGLAW